eukprot:sb/3474085/
MILCFIVKECVSKNLQKRRKKRAPASFTLRTMPQRLNLGVHVSKKVDSLKPFWLIQSLSGRKCQGLIPIKTPTLTLEPSLTCQDSPSGKHPDFNAEQNFLSSAEKKQCSRFTNLYAPESCRALGKRCWPFYKGPGVNAAIPC